MLGLLAVLAAGAVLFVPAAAQADTQASATSRLGDRTLRVGHSGADVKELQELLRKAGFKTGADGQYGSSTAATVRRFQRAAHLKVTGVADKRTVSRLRRAASGEIEVNASGGFDVRRGSPRNHHLGDRIPLRRGMQGHDVKVLQDYLRRAGFRTGIDGEFGKGTWRSVRRFERDQQRAANGVMDAADIDLLRSLVDGDKGLAPDKPAQPAALTPGEKAKVGPDGLAIAPEAAPDQVKQIIAAGNAIAKKPYRYGGGHGKWQDTGYDCSGSVSYALHGADLLKSPLASGDFMSWGEKGPGRWVTIYAHGGHMYMVVAGLRFDTSGRQEDGTRWHTSTRSTSGYTVVHPPGL
ncbi:MAG: peptidoglycan-binding protein [Solirubrobacterales bacterium]|nr:peptidoglycan-binding protein [Solirubrobacterales bacterium]